MQLPAHEYTRIQVALGSLTEHFIFSHNGLECSIDLVEVLIGSRLMAVDFVLHFCLGRGCWNAALDEEEIWSIRVSVLISVVWK